MLRVFLVYFCSGRRSTPLAESRTVSLIAFTSIFGIWPLRTKPLCVSAETCVDTFIFLGENPELHGHVVSDCFSNQAGPVCISLSSVSVLPASVHRCCQFKKIISI
jgi:hypothetical protein